MPFNEHDFKHCLASFPTGVTVVATQYEGKPYGVTINAFCSVSLHPPLILFCLDKRASTLPIFEQAASFTISILKEGQEEVSRVFSQHPNEPWAYTPFLTGQTGCPIIAEHAAFLECERYATHAAGDHMIFIGKVLNLGIAEGKPLLYHKSNYFTVGENV